MLPEELLLASVMGVVTLAFGDVGSPASVGKRDGDGDVIQLKVRVLQLKFNVDIATSLTVV